MLIRALTALLLGLSLAGPSRADPARDPETSAAPHLSGGAAESVCDVAFGCENVQAHRPGAHAAYARAETILSEASPDIVIEAAGVELAARPIPLDLLAIELALMPELFLDANEDETFAWIAKDLADAGELVTGSLSPEAPGSSPPFAIQDDLLFFAAEPTASSDSPGGRDDQPGAALDP